MYRVPMYVTNGILEFQKNRNRISDFQLERFSGFQILFSAGKFRNSELRSGIPDSGRPRNRNPKSEFPTKISTRSQNQTKPWFEPKKSPEKRVDIFLCKKKKYQVNVIFAGYWFKMVSHST
jgi:hypothetical protein